MTTDLCPAHRSDQIEIIRKRLKEGKPCRVVTTQCIEAGVDLDFDVMFRALAPLEAIIQASGRCNRNGRITEGGRMIVFKPACDGRKYPGNWYNQGAVTVEQMYAEHGCLDLNDPKLIEHYYQILFNIQSEKKDKSELSIMKQIDKPELTAAIEERDYAKTRKEYRFIDTKGVQVIVPYGKTERDYSKIKEDLQMNGLKRTQMQEYAPYTVTCLLPLEKITQYAEAIPLPCKNRKKQEKKDHSGYYMLHPQCLEYYTSKMGLQIKHENNEQLPFAY